MSDLQKCPECPWIGYGLDIHLGIMHHSFKKQQEVSRKIEQIAALLEDSDYIAIQDLRRLTSVLVGLLDRVRAKRQKEGEEELRIYNEFRDMLVSKVGGTR